MAGTVPTTKWKEMNLVFGRLKFQTLMGSRPFLTIPGLNFALSMVMEYGLIEFQLGSDMPLLILMDLQLHMMEFIGIHHLQKGLRSFFLFITLNLRNDFFVFILQYHGYDLFESKNSKFILQACV